MDGAGATRARACYSWDAPQVLHLLPAFMTALMIPLLTGAGLAGFWLFYKSVDFFDHI